MLTRLSWKKLSPSPSKSFTRIRCKQLSKYYVFLFYMFLHTIHLCPKVDLQCPIDAFKGEAIHRGNLKKNWIVPEGMDLSAYCFRETVEGDDVVEEDLPLSSLPSLIAAIESKPPKFPLLYLVDRANQNKLDFEATLSSLLEHSISECKEVHDFRQHMATLRQGSAFKIDAIEYPMNIVKTSYTGAAPSVITVKVFHAGKISASKLARLQPAMPAIQAIEEVVKKMQMAIEERNRDRPVSSWILKVVGRHEFIFGDAALLDHRHVRDCISNCKELCLKLVLRTNEAKKLAKSKRHSVVMTASHFASIDALSDFSSGAQSSDFLTEPNSSGEQDGPYSLSLVNICVPNSLLDKIEKSNGEQRTAESLGTVFCEFGVVFGVESLSSRLKQTPEFKLQASPGGSSHWEAAASNYVVSFDSLLVSQIPFGSKVTCTVYYRSKGKDSELGGLTFTVYTHQRTLVCGGQLHTFWTLKHLKANPLSVVIAENKSIRGACSINLKFSAFQENFIKKATASRSYVPQPEDQVPTSAAMASLSKLISADALSVMTSEDKQLMWQHRHWARSLPHALCKVLQSVNWTVQEQEIEIVSMIKEWQPLSHQDALGLLDACYAHSAVRSHAVSILDSIDDDYLLGIMLQLTQALKYEPYHESALGRFLLSRALKSRLIGHRFFWYLKAEIHQIEIRERYGLMIEAYLHACGDFRRDIFRENKVLNDLTAVGNIIKSTPTAERLQKLRQELAAIQFPVHPDGFLIPTDFGVRVKGLIIEKCKYMDSKKLPLWLVFENADPDGANVYVIFKVGDDLRQDILTLQMITLMYHQVQNSSLALDLRMRPYSVVATGSTFLRSSSFVPCSLLHQATKLACLRWL